MAKLRAAIVGAGLMGRWHAQYLTRVGGQVVAIADRNLESARGLQQRYPLAQIFSEGAEAFQEQAVDVVHLCTHVDSHRELTLAALHAGKHVMVEKPMAGSAGDVRELIEVARAKGLQLCPVHQFPFQEGFRDLHRTWDRLGEIVSLDFTMCTAGGAGLAEAERRELLLSILAHPLSILSRLGLVPGTQGALVSLSDQELRIHSVVDDDKGVSILISLRGRPTRNELRIVGTKRSALVDFYHGFAANEGGSPSRLFKAARPLLWGKSTSVAAGLNLAKRAYQGDLAYPGLRRLIHEFYRTILTGQPAPISFEEMLIVASGIDRVRELSSVP